MAVRDPLIEPRWLRGSAICLACERQWEAILEVDADEPQSLHLGLECPSCGQLTGVFQDRRLEHGTP